ncbi:MAG TPA: hypothetical protein VEX88_04440 [Glaciibacter sp.]|nr:hypothetical protein [Glaciibacter sp.]
MAGRMAIAGGVLTLALGLLTACGPSPAGSGGLVGHVSGTSDVAGQPGAPAASGGGLAILPIAVMDGPFWELTGVEPLADPQEWAELVVPLSKSDVSELGGTVTPIDEDGDFRVTVQPGEYAVCYWPGEIGRRVNGCADLEVPREGELAALWGEGGFDIAVKE